MAFQRYAERQLAIAKAARQEALTLATGDDPDVQRYRVEKAKSVERQRGKPSALRAVAEAITRINERDAVAARGGRPKGAKTKGAATNLWSTTNARRRDR